MTENNPRLGIMLMIATCLVFAAQDGISRHLAGEYNAVMVVTIRYWFFALFVIAISSRSKGGLKRIAATGQLGLQVFRGVLLALEIVVTVIAFVLLGLVETHAIFTCYPLLVAALSGPVLGEKVGWRRWMAIGIGTIGMLIILQPGFAVFSPYALIALFGALTFALYALLTRYVARTDRPETSFFWTGIGGAVAMTLVGPFFFEPMARADWGWMALLCITGATGHWLLIRCYATAEASVVQPFAFMQLVFVSVIGVGIFGEALEINVVLGAAIIVGAGLFTLWRERQKQHSAPAE